MKGALKGVAWFTAIAAMIAMPTVAAFADPPVAKKVIDQPTNVPPVPRAMPDLTPYWDFDPPKHPLFDISRVTISGDMRVRPELRSQANFGTSLTGTGRAPGNNDFYVQQWMRLGINYAISPDVDVFFQPQWAKNWGAAAVTGTGVAATTACAGNACANDSFNGGQGDSLFARQAWIMIRNVGIQNLNVKLGRQLIVMGNHRLFGHFDWANTGFSHDGMTIQYSQPTWEYWGGWLREAEYDFSAAGAPFTSSQGVLAQGTSTNGATQDANLFFSRVVFKPMAGLSIEPLWVYLANATPAINTTNPAAGVLAAHAADQHRHTVGGRVAYRSGGYDGTFEGYWQFGDMAIGNSGNRAHINAYALASEMGYTFAALPWSPRIGLEFNYASGDGDALACQQGNAKACNGTANTFENLYPTNHILMGYADLMAWRNMVMYAGSVQFKPSASQHVEIKYWNARKAVGGDCWYRAAQSCYYTQNTGSNYLFSELDGIYTLFLKDNHVAWQLGGSYIWAGQFLDKVAGAGPASNAGTPVNQIWAYTQIHVYF